MTRNTVVVGIALLSILTTACGSEEYRWDEDDLVAIYEATLEAVYEELHGQAGAGDTMIVDARPRHLVPAGTGFLRIGDFNPWGDPALSGAIERGSGMTACITRFRERCGLLENESFVVISEMLAGDPRDAFLLAARYTLRDDEVLSDDFIVQLRLRRGAWSVTRIEEGNLIRLADGFEWTR